MSVLVGGSGNRQFPASKAGKTENSTPSPFLMGDDAGPSREGSEFASASSAASPQLLNRQFSKQSTCESEEEGDLDTEDGAGNKDFVVSPIVPLREQLEKDKDDESLRRWKEQLLGSVVLDPSEGTVEPEVRVLSISILSAGRPDIVIPLPLPPNSKSHLFTLKEGSTYNIKFTFTVRNNIVLGLRYKHTVWKNGFRVDNTKVMLGTFSPQVDPYTHIMEEETTPSGLLARGSYTSRTRLVDDDGRIHLEIQHTFDIRKDWQ